MFTIFMIVFMGVNAVQIHKKIQTVRYEERVGHPERWDDGMAAMGRSEQISNSKSNGDAYYGGVSPAHIVSQEGK